MDFLFGQRKTPEEMLRQNQRALTRAMRALDRQRQELEQQEMKIIADIKKMAKQGQRQNEVRIMAKSLVHTRRYMKTLILMRGNIQVVSLKIERLKCNNSMAQAMIEVTENMATMNRQFKLPQIQEIMMELKEQSEIMDMKEEVMNDGIDDALDDEEDEEETYIVQLKKDIMSIKFNQGRGSTNVLKGEVHRNVEVARVLDELYLTLSDDLSKLPSPRGSLSLIGADYERKVSENTVHRSLLYKGSWSHRSARGPMLTSNHHRSVYNGHRRFRTGAWSNERRPGLMNQVFFFIMWMVGCVTYLWKRWQ